MIVMFAAARPVGGFIQQHPTTKMLALAFLLMIGLALMADGFHFISRAATFIRPCLAALVEFLNVLARGRRRPIAADKGATDDATRAADAGGSRGIGAPARGFAGQRGYDVAVNYKTNAMRGECGRGGQEIGRQGCRAARRYGVEADIERVFDEATRALGGYAFPAQLWHHRSLFPARRSDTEMMREVFAIDTFGALLCLRACSRRMSTKHGGKGGSVVMVSSMAAIIGAPGECVWYAGAKARSTPW